MWVSVVKLDGGTWSHSLFLGRKTDPSSLADTILPKRTATGHAPPFHMMAFGTQLIGPLYSGLSTVMWMPSEGPPPIPTPERILYNIRAAQCTSIMTVPAFLKTYAKDRDSIETLRNMEKVVSLLPISFLVTCSDSKAVIFFSSSLGVRGWALARGGW